MDKLPIEVLHRIFCLLSLSQRIKCTLVCRLWWRTLDTRSLLYDINIDSEFRYSLFKDMIERLPYRSTQVEDITLKYCLDYDYDKRKICNMFPNARKICLINEIGVGVRDFSNKRFHCINSKPRLEELTEYGACELTSFMISMNLSANIRKLELELGETVRKRDNNIIHQLKNMPFLEKLKLQNFVYVIEDFERLHEKITSIKELELVRIRIHTIDMPAIIKPASSITGLSLSVIDLDGDSCSTWLQYLAKKYDHLNQLSINDFDTEELDAEYIATTLKEDLIRLLQVNAFYLQTLSWNNLPFHLTIPEELDSIECKLENLDLRSNKNTTSEFENLALSNQSKYIKNLSLTNIKLNRIDLLNKMEKLTSLSLTCELKDGYGSDSFSNSDSDDEDSGEKMMMINLSDTLEACLPTLTAFSIKNFDFKFRYSTHHPTSITSLYIECSTIRKKLTDIISTCFPKLTSLQIYGNILDDLSINLVNHKLLDVSFSPSQNKRAYNLSVENTNKCEPSFYIPKHNSFYVNLPGLEKDALVPVPYDELDGRPVLTLICNSIQRLKLNSCPVKL
ncbi:hypothetical protein K501DRAFT_270385 [Backusella circina FSU 941]|nr:hypothetical protein K501DRAFT_270385 [Backusella circina FSU 941]